ncbi:MAG: YdbL family protein [Halothiobacillaceae bacterium]|nr:YdbL family protein [Halothiobacillaceae bacterium]
MKIIRQALIALLLALGTGGFHGAAFALDLEQAKTQGLVGEQPDGYLGVVNASPEAVALAASINQQRREAYARIAKQNGITVEQVAALAGEKAIARTTPGGYVKTPAGKWVRK